MKQTLHIIAFAAVALAALVSCAKEEFKENAIPAGESIEVSLSGHIGEFTPADATKATAESVVRVTWGSGDKVYVYDGGNASIGTLTVTPDENNASYAMLSGTITASAASPSKLTLVYVKGATEAPAIAGGKVTVDLSAQSQTEVPFVLYATVDYNAAALTKTNEYISFDFATSVMTVNCTGLQTGASGAVEGIDKAEIDGVSTACELTVDGSGVTAVAGTTPGKITRTEITGTGASVFQQSDSRGFFRLALAADPTAPAARNILVFQGSNVSGASFTSTTLATGKSYNTVYQMEEYATPPAGMLSGGFTVNAQGKKVYFSKGNLTYNVSTSFWAFYEHQYDCATAYDANLISLFTWGYSESTSCLPAGKTYISSHPIIRDKLVYNKYSSDGGDDWGVAYCESNNIMVGTWRTLTAEEWQYLFSYDGSSIGGENYDNDTRRGNYKCGVTVCGKTNCAVLLPDNWQWEGAVGTGWQNDYPESSTQTSPVTWLTMQEAGAVCLPAAGSRFGSNFNYTDNVGSGGNYWSSSSGGTGGFSGTDFLAFTMHFDSSKAYPLNVSCNIGYCVRLVTEYSDGYAPAVKVTGVSLNKNKTTIEVGDSEKLVATFGPANATDRQIIWSSSDTSVATVDQKGKVTGVAEGSAVITATTADGNFTVVCLVTVKQKSLFLTGEFSISGTKKVHFSRGNLYTKKESGEWKWNFYDKQYEFLALDMEVSGSDYNPQRTVASTETEIDLFTWGFGTWSTSPDGSTYQESDFTDWGSKIGDGNTWRTLTKDEWTYLFNTRTMTNGKDRYSNAVNGVVIGGTTYKGVFLYPDNYNGDMVSASVTWAQINADGIIFLPAAGWRDGSYVRKVGNNGYYWSSSLAGYDNDASYYVDFNIYAVDAASSFRKNGYSVRLVTECP